jgi:3',5'-cyclic AMP phosphodiesterase CpdA
MVHLAHLSDIHITAPTLEWRRGDYFNKRIAGWINFRWLGRRYRFRRAPEVLQRLARDLRERRPDHVVFSGDATAMGFESEFKRAAALLGVGDPSMPSGLAVPGNHDYYTRHSATLGGFERHFAAWQRGVRVDDEVYPFAQRVGHLTLIAVNSSAGNRWAWDASGRVGKPQLERLERLLRRLEPGPRILVTHYPVCLSSGRREYPWRGLRDAAQLIEVAARGGVRLWLHGHRHASYHLVAPPRAPFPVVNAGSATQTKVWSYAEYHFEGNHCRVTRRTFDPGTGAFRDGQVFELMLAE